MPKPRKKKRIQQAETITIRVVPLLFIGVILVLGSGGLLVAAQQENNDPFCASCHTQPEAQYVTRALAETGPVDLASSHATHFVHCIDCHSGPGLVGRAGALTQGASDLAAYASGHYRQPAVTTSPVGDSACLKCHESVTAVEGRVTLNTHFHVFLARWQAQDPGHAGDCVSCHSPHQTGNTKQAQWINQAQVQEVCQACHAVLRGDEG